MKKIFALLIVACSLSFALPLHAGEWEVKLEQSALGDNGPLKIKLPLHAISSTTPSKGENGELSIECRKGKIRSTFHFPGNRFPSDGIEYSLDKGAIVTDTGWETLMLDSSTMWGTNPLPFLKDLIGKSNLAIRFGIRSIEPVEMTFDISGFDEVAKEITKQCGIAF